MNTAMNPKDDGAADDGALAELGRVHFLGIGGVGVSAVARIMLARGITISGSDAKDLPVLRELAGLGARINVGYAAEHLGEVDTVVMSSVIKAGNPEFEEARRRGLRILHRSEGLAAAMAGQRVVAVAGTHGKTTTTSLITVMLRHAGLDPSFAIGANVAALGVNAAHGSGDVFVAEADESDGSFLNYRPAIAVVTNVEADHLDHYGTAEAVYESFDRFVDLLPADGLLVVCADDPGTAALAARLAGRGSGARISSYGYSAGAALRVSATTADGPLSSSRLDWTGADGAVRSQELVLQVPGEHNILNAAAAFAVALELGVDPGTAAAGLASFTGASRRFEAKGLAGGVRVFDDYAHHPTEVTAALRAARTVAGGHRVHVLFQPHLFSRTREFAADFARALDLADTALVLDVYAAREEPVPGVTSELISRDQRTGGGYAPDAAAALRRLAEAAAPGDIILTVGAGDVTQYGAQILALLAARTPGEDGAGDN